MAETWKDLGARVAWARKVAGLSQAALASQVGLDRSSLSRIETGERKVDALELVALGEALGRSIAWFTTADPRVASWREGGDEPDSSRAAVLLDELRSDVAQLRALGLIAPASVRLDIDAVKDVRDAEQAAVVVRRALGNEAAPIVELERAVEPLGLLAYVADCGAEGPEGGYGALEDGLGVAVINGAMDLGRRRFTLAHEVGHHVLADEYHIDWGGFGEDESEKLVNAFAIHLLMPGVGVRPRFEQLAKQGRNAREAAIIIAAEYGASWTAACPQLMRLGVIDKAQRDALLAAPPRQGDYLELAAAPPPYPGQHVLSPSFSSAVLRALRRNDISKSRALEMLRGTLAAYDLPAAAGPPPLDAFGADLDPM